MVIAYNRLSEIYSLPEIAALLDGPAPTDPRDRTCDPRAIEALTATSAALLGLIDAFMDLGDDDIAAANAVIDAKGLRLLAKIAHWLQRPLKPVLLQQMGGDGAVGWMGGYVWYLATVTLWRLIGPLVEKNEQRLSMAACVQVQASGGGGGGGWNGGEGGGGRGEGFVCTGAGIRWRGGGGKRGEGEKAAERGNGDR